MPTGAVLSATGQYLRGPIVGFAELITAGGGTVRFLACLPFGEVILRTNV